MQDVPERCMGLDIHRDTIAACLPEGKEDCQPTAETRSFGTMRPQMKQLRDWILESGCRYVAMESTGIYWQPIYEMLENCFDGDIRLLVVNARHMKNVPGRKTDIRDAEWIATLLRAGLLKGSFVPDKPFRELRHLTRYRKSIIESAGKRKSVAVNKGNSYIKTMLCEVAWVVAGHREMYLSGWYWRVKQQRGAKRATVALARKLLVLIFTILRTGELYNEQYFETRRKACERKRTSRMVSELTRLGYKVESPA